MNTPYRYIPLVSNIYRSLKRRLYTKKYSGNGVFCNQCQESFKSWLNGKAHGVCPQCGSSTRHRILSLYLDNEFQTPHPKPLRTLYFAPNTGQEDFFKKRRENFNCITADLSAPGVDHHTDITDLIFKDNSFHLIICCHVLEHVPNDTRAIAELHRVLKSGGISFVQIPYAREAEKTDEDFSITDPKEREKRFGQFDHVRLYGKDIVDRLKAPGFEVEKFHMVEKLTEDEQLRLGIWDDPMFICRKK